MLPYYLLYSVIGVSAFLSSKSDERKTKIRFFQFSSLTLVLLMALRHPSMGIDLGYRAGRGYLNSFNILSGYSWPEIIKMDSFLNYEKGYVVLNKLISIISKDQQFLLIVCAAISLIPMLYIIYKNSDMPYFSLVIYLGLPCFLIVFSGLRQAIAISITFCAYEFIKKKKPVKFAAMVMLAALFHKSAIIFIIAYPIYHIEMSQITRQFSMVLFPLVFILRKPLFYFLSPLLKDHAHIDNNGALNLFITFVLIFYFVSVFGNEQDEEERGCRNLFFIACLIQALGGLYSTAIRLGYYFMIYLALCLPKVIGSFNNRDKLVFKTLIAACFLIFGLYSIFVSKNSWALANPYNFFWAK